MEKAKPLKILFAEDVPSDAELAIRQIRKSGLTFTSHRVDTEEAFVNALREFHPDVIVSDYSMGTFNGMLALKRAQEWKPGIPFIILTGSMNEETAVECLRAGAMDYVLKDRMIRLPFAIREAIEQRTSRVAKDEAEKSLRESEERFRRLFENSIVGMFQTSTEGRLLRVNTAYAHMFGYDSAEEIIQDVQDISAKLYAHREQRRAVTERLTQFGFVEPTEFEVVRRDRSKFWVLLTAQVVKDADGKVLYYEGTNLDITARKRSEQDLKKSFEWQNAIFEGSRDAVFITDADSRFISINGAACDLTGFSKEDLLMMSIPDLHEHPDRSAYKEFHHRIMKGEHAVTEAKILRKDGTKVDTEFNNTRIIIDGVMYMHTSARDVSERKRAEEMLSLLSVSVENASDAAFWTTREGRFAYVNKAACKSLGYEREELMRLTIHDVNPNAPAPVWDKLWEEFSEKRTIQRESKHCRKDGRQFPVEIVSTFLTFNGVQYICGFARDISDRKLAEEALELSERRYRNLAESSPEMIYVVDRAGRLTYINETAALQFRASPGLLVGKHLSEIFPSSIAQHNLEAINTVFQTKRSASKETLMQFPSGEKWLETRLSPVLDEEGNVSQVMGLSTDISERKKSERALQDSEERFRSLFTFSPDALYVHVNGRVILVNPAMCKLLGADDPSQLLGKSVFDIVYADYHKKVRERLNVVLSGQPAPSFDEKFVRLDGTLVDVGVTAVAVDWEGSKGVQVIARDITERKRSEGVLRENEEFFRLLFTASPDGIILFDPNSTRIPWEIVDCNEVACRMNGYTREELLGKSINMLNLKTATREERDSYFKLVEEKGINCFETAHRHRDGHVFPIEVAAATVVRGGRKLLLGIDRDITERKRSEEALLAKERYQRAMLDNFPFAVWLKDTESRFLAVNEQFAKTFNITSADELVGKSDFDIVPLKIAEEYRAHDRAVMESRTNSVSEQELIGLGENKWFETYKAPILGANNVLLGTVGFLRDITERKRSEEELIRNETLLRTTVENLPLIFYIIDPRGTFRLSVGAGLQGLGLVPNQIVGQSVFDVYKDHPTILDSIKKAINGESMEFESNVAGSTFANFVVPYYTSKGVYAGVVGVALDITERKKAEQTQRLLNTALEAAINGVVITDLKGSVVWVNNAFTEMTGYSSAEIIGQNPRILKSGQQDTEFYKQLWKSISAGNPWKGELINRKKDGSLYTDEMTITPLKNEKGEITNFIAIKQDVTERKRTQEAIQESEERFRMVFEHVFDGISIYSEDPDPSKRKLIECNERYATLAGRSREELLQRGSTQDLQKILEADAIDRRLDSLNKNSSYWGTYSWIRPDGMENIIEYVGVPITWRGKPHSIVIDRDVTERKRAEERINLLAHTLKSISECVSISDLNDAIIYINDAFLSTYGYSESQILGKNISTVGSPKNSPKLLAELHREARKGGWQGEMINRRKDGTEFPISLSTSIVRDDFGRALALVGVATDITERKRVQEALTYERNLLRALMDNVPDHIYFKDEQSRFLRISRSQANQFGLDDPSVAVGKTDFDFFSEEHARLATKDEREIIRTGIALVDQEEKETWPDGRESWVSTTKVPLQDINGTIMGTFGISRDISERRQAETELRDSQEKYKSLFDRNLAATFVSTPSGHLLDCNPAYVSMFGFDSLNHALATNMGNLYADKRNRDMVLSSLEEQKKAENLELRMVKTDGTPMFIIANFVGKFDEQGRLIQKTGYLIDDTRRHGLEKELMQSQKLESLGILAGGIAHDFNNILGILMGHVSLLDRLKNDPQLHQTSLDAIDTALKRGTGLVRQLLTFARKTDVEFAPLLVNDVVKELVKLLRETLPKTIEIVAELNPKLPLIMADGGQVHQVLLNLSVNARDAMRAGGRIRIQTNLVNATHIRQRFPDAPAEQYISIEVRDTGTGMDEVTKSRIFEPFFTTKESGKGTGLGLAVVFGIVQTHKGYINVESEIGKGTTFCVYLPVELIQSQTAGGRKAVFEESAGGHESILFVEDEVLLYETSKIALTSKGYKLFYAKDGLEAIDLYRQHFEEINLVLTDMDLPKMGGEKLIRALLEINPKLKIIFASGYVEPEVKATVMKMGARAFLAKPYDHVEMLSKIRQALDSKD